MNEQQMMFSSKKEKINFNNACVIIEA